MASERRAYREEARPRPDVALAEYAETHHGVVTVAALAAMGLDKDAVSRRVRSGRLHPWHRGVYAIGRRGLSPEGRWLAAVLACGHGAALSHRSSAARWGLRRTSRTRIDVTVPRTTKGPDGIDVHRTRSLSAADVTVHDGIPVTTVARTLADLAEVLDGDALAKAVHEAEVLRLLDVGAVRDVAVRLGGRHRLGRLLDLLDESAPPTRSELERAFLVLCHRAGVPPPAVNAMVGPYEVDFLWRDRGLVVEVDGAAVHHTRRAFERDRERDLALTLQGLTVVRLTWRRLTRAAREVERDLRRLVARPGSRRRG